jgi:hypothetical protein
MHKNATKCKQNTKQLVYNKHGVSKIIDMFVTYQALAAETPYMPQGITPVSG